MCSKTISESGEIPVAGSCVGRHPMEEEGLPQLNLLLFLSDQKWDSALAWRLSFQVGGGLGKIVPRTVLNPIAWRGFLPSGIVSHFWVFNLEPVSVWDFFVSPVAKRKFQSALLLPLTSYPGGLRQGGIGLIHIYWSVLCCWEIKYHRQLFPCVERHFFGIRRRRKESGKHKNIHTIEEDLR